MRSLGDQLREAREKAGLKKTELGRRIGWKDNTNVHRVEGGGSTDTADMLKWAAECGYEVLVVPQGSAESVAGRLHDADERERRVASALLDLLREARTVMPHLLDHVEDDVKEWSRKIERRRAMEDLDADDAG
jgi:transcriptional regulator with XRE-family HTH domain